MKVVIFLLASFTLVSCFDSDVDEMAMTAPVGLSKDGKKQGEWKTLFVNGKIAKIENFLNDTLHGIVVHFDQNGQMTGKEFYKMGTPIDSFILYFSNGHPNLEEWRDSTGRSQGLFKIYHQNGQLSQIGFMKDSKLNDTCKTFFEDGHLKSVEFYKNEKKEGTWVYLSEGGDTIRVEEYKNDILLTSKQ